MIHTIRDTDSVRLVEVHDDTLLLRGTRLIEDQSLRWSRICT